MKRAKEKKNNNRETEIKTKLLENDLKCITFTKVKSVCLFLNVNRYE